MESRAINLSPLLDRSAAPQVLDRTHLLDEVRRLSTISPGRSAMSIAVQWLVIGAAAVAAVAMHHWYIYVAAVLVIATRQNALLVLMHDAAHYRLFDKRGLNDLLSDLFLALPLALSTSLYRRTHLAHHRFLNGVEDPDRRSAGADELWHWPKARRGLGVFAGDLLGLHTVANLRMVGRWSPWPRMFKPHGSDEALPVARCLLPLAMMLVVPVTLILTHLWLAFMILWLLPAFTLLPAIFRLRTIAEHAGTRNENELNASRSVAANWFERLMIAPCNVHFHLEHHLFPSVPWHNLGRLHRLLGGEAQFRERAHRTAGYLNLSRGVLGELCPAGAANATRTAELA